MKTTVAHSTIGYAGSLATVWFTLSGLETTLRILGAVGSLIVTILAIISWVQKLRAGGDKNRVSDQ
jgi:hypothetical protein